MNLSRVAVAPYLARSALAGLIEPAKKLIAVPELRATHTRICIHDLFIYRGNSVRSLFPWV
jgi:hypothetical protein